MRPKEEDQNLLRPPVTIRKVTDVTTHPSIEN
jgi:hypothetical protein